MPAISRLFLKTGIVYLVLSLSAAAFAILLFPRILSYRDNY